MKKIYQKILAFLSRLMLMRYKPRIVGITGSVGKTSTKEAVAKVLASKYKVRANQGNYNNEIGLPLTILGEKPANNFVGWLLIIVKALIKLIASDYPQILVLEMGSDKPGDISYLVKLIGKLDVGVITDIGISHLEFYNSPEELAAEKLSLIKNLTVQDLAVLNFDNPKVYGGKNKTKGQVIGFGFEENAEIRAIEFQIKKSEEKFGINFKVQHKGTVVPFFLPSSLGRPMVYAALAASSVGLKFNIHLVDASEALRNFNPLPGRLRLLKGIKRTWIIDDTYNAAPASTIAALEVLDQIATKRKLAAIGGMAELGNMSEEGHREVARKIMEAGVKTVFLVGSSTHFIEDELKLKKYKGKILWFEKSEHARIPVQNELMEGDTILVKGSQSARMEKIVKEIMNEPQKSQDLLVRQSEQWLK